MILSSWVAAKYRGVLPDRRPLCRYATFPPLPGGICPSGGTESAAPAEALSVICGLQCAYRPQIPVRSAMHSQPNVLMIFCPSAGRNSGFSPCLSTSVLRNIGGDGGCVSIASMVTMWVGQGALSPVSSQPSQSSRRGLDAGQNDDSSGVSTAGLVNNPVLIFEPSVIYIQIPGERIGLILHIQKLNQLCCCAFPGIGQHSAIFETSGIGVRKSPFTDSEFQRGQNQRYQRNF